MCLYLFSTGCQCCKDCYKDCLRNCPNPLMILFNLFVGIPCAFLFLLGGGLIPAMMHWPFGSWNQMSELWKHVCLTLKQGRQAYGLEQQGQRPPRRTIEDQLCGECCTAALAEVYCILLPVFVIITPFIPVWILCALLLDVIFAAIGGACSGCVDKVSDWWPRVSDALRKLDYLLAADALRAEKAPFWSCYHGGNMLPTHAPPPNMSTGGQSFAASHYPQQAANYAQTAHHYPQQTAHYPQHTFVPSAMPAQQQTYHGPPPAQQRRTDQERAEQAAATAAATIRMAGAAAQVAGTLAQGFLANRAAQQRGTQPIPAQQATAPRARAVPVGQAAPNIAMGRPL